MSPRRAAPSDKRYSTKELGGSFVVFPLPTRIMNVSNCVKQVVSRLKVLDLVPNRYGGDLVVDGDDGDREQATR